ncbi:MAG: hypothetical protein LBE09_02560 [Christensenellaceae bacterium]|jgi:hypothetical protein|nr:hypothetical protein [Christensenellaceae bacterium]
MSKKSKIIVYSIIISLLELLILAVALVSLKFVVKPVEPLAIIDNNVTYSMTTGTYTNLHPDEIYDSYTCSGNIDVGDSIEILVPSEMRILVNAGKIVNAGTFLARNNNTGEIITAGETCKIESITEVENGTLIGMFALANQKIHFVLPVSEIAGINSNNFTVSTSLAGIPIKFEKYEYIYSTADDGYLFTLSNIDTALLRNGNVNVKFEYDIVISSNYRLWKRCALSVEGNYLTGRITRYNVELGIYDHVNVKLEIVREDENYYYVATDDYLLINGSYMVF